MRVCNAALLPEPLLIKISPNTLDILTKVWKTIVLFTKKVYLEESQAHCTYEKRGGTAAVRGM